MKKSKDFKGHKKTSVGKDKIIFQLKKLLNSLPGDIYWKDLNGIWSGVNDHCLESLYRMGFIEKRDEKEVLGKSDFEIFDKESAKAYRKNDSEVVKKGVEIEREEITRLPSGKIITLFSIKKPFLDENEKVIGVIGNTIDISDRKRLESKLRTAKKQADAASKAKTTFLENMRHDVRTPLTGIVGFSELIQKEAKDKKISSYAHQLLDSSHALLALMDEVLDAVKVGTGEIPISKRKFSLKEMLKDVLKLYRAKAGSKGLKLSLAYDTKLPKYVIADKVRIHRVIVELVANALNYTDKGEVKISAHLAKKKSRDLVLKLMVQDTGIGIEKAKQQEIFLEFKRLSPSYQGLYQGAGLGLYVVKQFIDELKGEIYVSSQPLQGSLFTCLIPLRASLLDDNTGVDELKKKAALSSLNKPSQAKHKVSKPKNKSTKTKNHPRLLVVEDNPIAQSVVKSMLTHFKCEVDIAENGELALQAYEKHQYHLIIMDIGLPDMDGCEVTRKICSKDKLHPPIVALTAHAGDDNKKRCLEAGMVEVFIKPLTAEYCRDMLCRFVHLK